MSLYSTVLDWVRAVVVYVNIQAHSQETIWLNGSIKNNVVPSQKFIWVEEGILQNIISLTLGMLKYTKYYLYVSIYFSFDRTKKKTHHAIWHKTTKKKMWNYMLVPDIYNIYNHWLFNKM